MEKHLEVEIYWGPLYCPGLITSHFLSFPVLQNLRQKITFQLPPSQKNSKRMTVLLKAKVALTYELSENTQTQTQKQT